MRGFVRISARLARHHSPRAFGESLITKQNMKGKMKHKYLVIIGAAVLGLTVTLFAVERQSGVGPPTLIRLKSNGDTIAELRLPKGPGFMISAKNSNYDVRSERNTAKGDVTIRIEHAGGSPVIVKADEIEAIPDRE